MQRANLVGRTVRSIAALFCFITEFRNCVLGHQAIVIFTVTVASYFHRLYAFFFFFRWCVTQISAPWLSSYWVKSQWQETMNLLLWKRYNWLYRTSEKSMCSHPHSLKQAIKYCPPFPESWENLKCQGVIKFNVAKFLWKKNKKIPN